MGMLFNVNQLTLRTAAMVPFAFSAVRRLEQLPEPPLPEPLAVLGAADA